MKEARKRTIILLAISILLFVLGWMWRFGGRFIPEKAGRGFRIGGFGYANMDSQAFAGIKLLAKSAYVFDISAGREIFGYNSEAQLPLASLTKVMTAVIAEKNLSADFRVPITKKAVMQEGDNGFFVGEKIRRDDLLSAMLVASSNDAAYAVAESYSPPSTKKFIYLMNKEAAKFGLRQTFFINPTGLDISANLAGAYGSAKDMSIMLTYAFKKYPNLFEATSKDVFYYGGKIFRTTDKLVNKIARILAGKTGYSDLAGGNLAVIVDIGFNHPVVIVALGSTEEGRFEDVEKLYRATIRYLRAKN